MVIAVMSMALEKVYADQDALVIKEKLIDIIAHQHRLPKFLKARFRKHKYLFVVEVDPRADFESNTIKHKSERDISSGRQENPNS